MKSTKLVLLLSWFAAASAEWDKITHTTGTEKALAYQYCGSGIVWGEAACAEMIKEKKDDIMFDILETAVKHDIPLIRTIMAQFDGDTLKTKYQNAKQKFVSNIGDATNIWDPEGPVAAQLIKLLGLEPEAKERLKGLLEIDATGFIMGKQLTDEERSRIEKALKPLLEYAGHRVACLLGIEENSEEYEAMVRAFEKLPSLEIWESAVKGARMDWKKFGESNKALSEALSKPLLAKIAQILQLDEESQNKLEKLKEIDLVGSLLGEPPSDEDKLVIEDALKAVLADAFERIAQELLIDQTIIREAIAKSPSLDFWESVVGGHDFDWSKLQELQEVLLRPLIAKLSGTLALSQETTNELNNLGKLDLIGFIMGKPRTVEDDEKIKKCILSLLKESVKKLEGM